MKIIKTSAYDLSKYRFSPQEEATYIRLDTTFQQIAKQRDEVNHELYKGSGLSPQQQAELKRELDDVRASLAKVGDQLYRLCEKARRRLENPQAQKARLTPSKGQEWLAKAVRRFGYTTNPWEAGYIHPNGKLLDFSGRKQGRAQPGQRALDHRQVGTLGEELSQIAGDERERSPQTQAMRTFMAHSGAIRLICQHGGYFLDMASVPTKQQTEQICRMAMQRDIKEIMLEAKTLDGREWCKEVKADAPDRPVPIYKLRQAIEEASRFLQQGEQ